MARVAWSASAKASSSPITLVSKVLRRGHASPPSSGRSSGIGAAASGTAANAAIGGSSACGSPRSSGFSSITIAPLRTARVATRQRPSPSGPLTTRACMISAAAPPPTVSAVTLSPIAEPTILFVTSMAPEVTSTTALTATLAPSTTEPASTTCDVRCLIEPRAVVSLLRCGLGLPARERTEMSALSAIAGGRGEHDVAQAAQFVRQPSGTNPSWPPPRPNGRRATRTVFGIGALGRAYCDSGRLFPHGRLARVFAHSPAHRVKVPTLHGVWAARNALSEEEMDAFTTHDRAQALLSTPVRRPPLTQLKHRFVLDGGGPSCRDVPSGPTSFGGVPAGGGVLMRPVARRATTTAPRAPQPPQPLLLLDGSAATERCCHPHPTMRLG